jgi:hypothetical protein
MALRDEISSTFQRITLQVRVGGIAVPDVFSVTVSSGYDQINAQATLMCATRPSWADELQPVEIWAGYNGQTAQIFGGELAGVTWDFFPTGVGLPCQDLLARTRKAWGGATRTYTAQDDAAVIRNILEAYGIPSNLANIESSGWTLGVIQDVTLEPGESGWSLIERIDNLAGYRTFTVNTGVILRRRVTGKAGLSAAWTATQGVDLLGVKRIRSLEGIVNRADVTGLTYEEVGVSGTAFAANPYIPDPPGTIGYEVQDDLIETDVVAGTIAQRTVGDRNRRPEHLELTLIGNPLLMPSMTIGVAAGAVEASGIRAFIQNVSHTVDSSSFTTVVTTNGGNLSGYEPGAPIAAFSVQLYQQGSVDAGGSVSSVIVGVADGSSSFDPDGSDALAFAWTGVGTGGGSILPASAATPVYRWVMAPGGTLATIDLTVTDSDGLTGSLSRAVPITTDALLMEDIWSAEGTIVAVSIDGQRSWREQPVPAGSATCLMPNAPDWGELWGTSAGHVYVSRDELAGTLTDLGQPAGTTAVTAVWVHELDSTRLWAGMADGRVAFGLYDAVGGSLSQDWGIVGTVPTSPIGEIRESYGALGEVRATAGSVQWLSGDGGASWAAELAGTATARRMAAGWERNAASFAQSNAVRYVEVSDEVFTPPISGARGIGFGWRQRELYVASDHATAAVLYLDSDLSGSATPDGTAPTDVLHLVRSGNEDRVVYLAGGAGGTAGVLKWLPQTAAPWYVRRTGANPVQMVGYGIPTTRIPITVRGDILLVTKGVTPGGLYAYHDGTWTLKNNGLPSGTTWWGIVACPFSPDRWMIWAQNTSTPTIPAMYYTEDAGETWSAIGLSLPSGVPSGIDIFISDVQFSTTTPGAWCAAGAASNGFALIRYLAIWRGTGTTVTASNGGIETSGTPTALSSVVPVASGAFVIADLPPGAPYGRLWRTDPAGLTPYVDESHSDTVASTRLLERLYGSNVALVAVGAIPPEAVAFGGVADGVIYTTADYTTTAQQQPIVDALGYSITATADGIVWVGGRDTGAFGGGVARIADILGTPTITTVPSLDGHNTGMIRCDRQTRSALVVRYEGGPSGGTNVALSLDGGTTWTVITGPPVTGAQISAWVEVVNRG